jgi:PAS domain S-box-containing protein
LAAATRTGRQGITEEVQVETTHRLVEITAHPSPTGVAFHFRDITDERDLRMRMRLLDAAMPRLNDAIVITKAAALDPPGPPVVFVNDAFERQTGYSRAEVLGRSPDMLVGEATECDRLAAIGAALARGEAIRTELTCYRKDGTTYSTDIDVNVLTDEDGTPTHFVAVHRDTTERRRTEEHLRLREEQFRLVSLASKDVIWDWDIGTGKVWHSDNVRQFFDWSGDTVAPFEETLRHVHAEDRDRFMQSVNRAFAGDGRDWHCDYRIHDAQGRIRHVADRGSILRDTDGKPVRMVAAMSDVTEMREMDSRLHMASKMQSIGQLTGGIAHDFNNLLTIVLGNSDMILDITQDEGVTRMVGSIIHAAERGADLAGSLLAYARRQQLETRPTDINHLILASTTLFSSAVDATIDIEYDLSPEEVVATVDPDKLQSALLNLVLNAETAMTEGGSIVMSTRRIVVSEGDRSGRAPGTYVQLAVTDTGSGMSGEVAEKAFEPFFTTRETGVGTGLGLSTVYGLVTQSGGHVDLDTAPGAGTTITLCLPATCDAPVGWPETRAVVLPSGTRADVLVVEDDGGVRSFVCEALKRMGHVVTSAQNGSAALGLFRAGRRFDVLCTDLVMPGEPNGLDLARLAQAHQPDLKILLMTGYADRFLETPGAADHDLLLKPFRSIDLAVKIQDALARPSDAPPP